MDVYIYVRSLERLTQTSVQVTVYVDHRTLCVPHTMPFGPDVPCGV